jgi:hypothetical protein
MASDQHFVYSFSFHRDDDYQPIGWVNLSGQRRMLLSKL